MTSKDLAQPLTLAQLDRKPRAWVEALYEYTAIRQEVRAAQLA